MMMNDRGVNSHHDQTDFGVRLHTTRGDILLTVHPHWAPRGAERFRELVEAGYYDDSAVFRVIAGKWAQFGIAADPRVAQVWRERTIPDEKRIATNARGTVAFAFKDPDGRTTQVFINLGDNRSTHDAEPFVPFAEVVEGMEIVDALYSGYAETSGGGIRAGRQGELFSGGTAYLRGRFPLLDYIERATIVA